MHGGQRLLGFPGDEYLGQYSMSPPPYIRVRIAASFHSYRPGVCGMCLHRRPDRYRGPVGWGTICCSKSPQFQIQFLMSEYLLDELGIVFVPRSAPIDVFSLTSPAKAS